MAHLKWESVTAEHVLEACRLVDLGQRQAPRSAKSTFLELSGRLYPAKFIRGLAYELATGVRPTSSQYQGGAESARFFEARGLSVRHNPAATTVAGQDQSKDLSKTALISRRALDRRKQKQCLADLLARRFASIAREVKFDWLTVPNVDCMDANLRRIFDALHAHRGHAHFSSAGLGLSCDYHIPGSRLLIEYDEAQHFTEPRAIALKLYPPHAPMGFDVGRWISECERVRAKDSTPPYRDEQRALYDSIRDLLAQANGYTLVRVMHGDCDWGGSAGPAHLDSILPGSILTEVASPAENTMNFDVSDNERKTVQRYLGMNPNHWTWEQLVRELLPAGSPRIEIIGKRVRKLFGTSVRPEDYRWSEDQIRHLVTYVRFESHLMSLAAGVAVATATRRMTGTTVAETGSGISPATDDDRRLVRFYLQKNWNRWYWEELVGDMLQGVDRSTVNAIAKDVRSTWAWAKAASAFDDAEIAKLISFIRDRAATITPRISAKEIEIPMQTPVTPELLARLRRESPVEKVALVSRDYNLTNGAGLWDLSEHFDRINHLCDEQGCDTVLYALYTWDLRSQGVKSHASIFANRSHLARVILEAGDLEAHSDDPGLKDLVTEIWMAALPTPVIVRQVFATSADAQSLAPALVSGLSSRQVGNAVLLICGETNLVSLSRGSGAIHDPCRILEVLDQADATVIFNPIHDYMRRYEMKEKRKYLSAGGRTVLSVWNQGRGAESNTPWTVFHDGVDQTSRVRELDAAFAERPDIRIGIVNLTQ